jgi:predicted secreted hydrolase
MAMGNNKGLNPWIVTLPVLIIIGLIIVIFGNVTFTKSATDVSGAATSVDDAARKDIYNVLWEKDLSTWPAGLPTELTEEKLKKISPAAFGKETATMLQSVKTAVIPLVQRYPSRYDQLTEMSRRGLTTRQANAIGNLMGLDYFNGYAGMNSIKELEFPRDYSSHNDFQVGWYFFSSSLTDQNGNKVDVLVNFFRRAIYPPDIAARMGLSEMDNQVVELHVGLSLSDKDLHIQGANPVISGKTGLLDFKTEPFLIKMGRNEVKSINKGSLFPLSLKVYDPEKDLDIDLTLEQTKPLFLEGDEGKVPSMYNLGTWYYSISNIKTTGTISYGGDKRQVSGKTWHDNQWTAGIMPAGYADNYYIRALANISNWANNQSREPWGWDWLQVQLDNNTEITLASMHSTHTKDLNNRGVNPPPESVRDATGKIINADGTVENISGTIKIDKWVKSNVSGAWYPNSWKVEVPGKRLALTMTPTVSSQMVQGAAASEFREGGVVVTGKLGRNEINGVGFGEGTGYAGEDYYYDTMFDILKIENIVNRKILEEPVPDIWLFIQSILLYLISVIAVIWIVLCLYCLASRSHPEKVEKPVKT